MPNDYITGLFLGKPREGAPAFVKGRVSILVDKFIPLLQEKANAKGYVNIDLLEAKSGELYFKLNEWKPEDTKAPF
jgi:hypothetical protein